MVVWVCRCANRANGTDKLRVYFIPKIREHKGDFIKLLREKHRPAGSLPAMNPMLTLYRWCSFTSRAFIHLSVLLNSKYQTIWQPEMEKSSTEQLIS